MEPTACDDALLDLDNCSGDQGGVNPVERQTSYVELHQLGSLPLTDGLQEWPHHIWTGPGRDHDLRDEVQQTGAEEIISLAGVEAGVNTELGPPPELPGVGEDGVPPEPAGIRNSHFVVSRLSSLKKSYLETSAASLTEAGSR